jgi:hypothetical protein
MEVGAGPAAFQEQRVPPGVVREETNGAVPAPQLERRRFMLALVVRPLDLEHDVAGGEDMRNVRIGKWLLEVELPLRSAFLDERRELVPPGSV